MDSPEWTDVMQAWTSFGTAVFTLLSLIVIGIYTWITHKTMKTAQHADEESLRPVLILFEISQSGQRRVARYINTGEGLALRVCRRLADGSMRPADSNVLAAGQALILDITDPVGEDVLDVRYQSLNERMFLTISEVREDGRILNNYIPDAKFVSEVEIAKLRQHTDESAKLANVQKLIDEVKRNTQAS